MAILLPEDQVPIIQAPVDSTGLVKKIVNNIKVSISPAVYVPLGPSNVPSEFQSKIGTGPSDPITITFGSPISNVSITIIGESFPGHITRALDTNGNTIAEYVSANNAINDDGNIMQFSGDELHTVSLSGNNITSVLLIPVQFADYVGYKNITIPTQNVIKKILPITPIDGPAPIIPVVIPVATPISIPDPTPIPAPVIPTEDPAPDVTPTTITIADSTPTSTAPIPTVTIIPAPVVSNTIRAKIIKDCYDIFPSFSPFVHSYNIGTISGDAGIIYKIRNNTTNATLQITLTIPDYIECNIGNSFIINALTIQSFALKFSESIFNIHISEAQNKILRENITLQVQVINPPDEPILVSSILPNLS